MGFSKGWLAVSNLEKYRLVLKLLIFLEAIMYSSIYTVKKVVSAMAKADKLSRTAWTVHLVGDAAVL